MKVKEAREVKDMAQKGVDEEGCGTILKIYRETNSRSLTKLDSLTLSPSWFCQTSLNLDRGFDWLRELVDRFLCILSHSVRWKSRLIRQRELANQGHHLQATNSSSVQFTVGHFPGVTEGQHLHEVLVLAELCGKALDDKLCGKAPEDKLCGKAPEDKLCGKAFRTTGFELLCVCTALVQQLSKLKHMTSV
ncbi:hypothetical protein RRG08_058338 [Elysia crispata]|uniref:Uncharacterized protein n=1 Tax=Elysia crispata TaxID=231223 RepID=A0AAE1E994_9GAST|nr:hypothetical protein RRG08_058338 [Elysia crispata]